MANKTLFGSIWGKLVPATDGINEEGAPAHKLTPKQALAQYAATGCLNGTFYATAEEQLDKVLALCREIDPGFIAKTAVYCRERGHMKDMPALLCAVLAVRDGKVLELVFDRVIDNGKMLRNFVQILRSGVVGRKSLGSLPKRLVQRWLDKRSDEEVFKAAVGQSPSIADVVRMVHPKPRSASRESLYGYLVDRPHKAEALPEIVRRFEDFKTGRTRQVPPIPFQMLTALDLGKAEWVEIARNASWQMTRMNLNTFARHGVFEEGGMTEAIAKRLRDPAEIRKARAFPYQLMVAYLAADQNIPAAVREALQDAMETAIENVPQIEGQVYVCPDVSGSMSSPLTGYRKGSSSVVRCIDTAALMAATIVRKNPTAETLPFEQTVVQVSINPRDTVLTNAERLASIGGGGTSCSAPLELLNKRRAKGDLVVLISDNESWVDAKGGRGTETMRQWSRFKERNRRARLVCIDLQPYATVQAAEREDILNVGGFSDEVFSVVSEFAQGSMGADHWTGRIENVELEGANAGRTTG